MFNINDIKTEAKRIGSSIKESAKEISEPVINWASENKKWLIAVGVIGVVQRITGYANGWRKGYDFCHDEDDERINTIRALILNDYCAKEESEAMAEICNSIDQLGPLEVLSIINGEDCE